MTNKVRKLDDYPHVRLKNEMYFGSRAIHTQTILSYGEDLKPSPREISWVPAIYTAFREILDNSMDEIIGHGFGDKLWVFYDESTRIMSVEDNGRGIPIDWDEEEGCHVATLALANLRAGRNFEERGEVAGTNGIGASGVNFCSEFFEVEIHQNGKKFTQKFSEGDGVHVTGDPKITPTKNEKTGTKISFRLSSGNVSVGSTNMRVFPDLTLPESFVRDRVVELAVANPLIKFYFNGQQIKVKPRPEQSLFPGMKPISLEIKEDSFRSRFWIVPGWIDSGEHVHTIVNNIPAFNGGVHIDTFRRLFYGNLLTALERESKRRKLQPNRSDVTEGILIYNITNMRAPNFDSQSKTRLINEEVGTILRRELDNPELYKEFIRKNKDWIEEIYQRCAERTMKRDSADLAKAAKKNLRNKVPRLMDATGQDRSKCILFLAEGDCLASDTLIKILRNGEWSDITISQIEIGDCVISHTSSIKEVTAISTKVENVMSIITNNGSFEATSNHKILAFNKEKQIFDFMRIADLNPEVHQLVRNKLVEHRGIVEITDIDEIDDGKYHFLVYFNNEVVKSSRTHKFAVFNLITAQFEMIECEKLNRTIHAMVIG